MIENTTAIILAGGKSIRMGSDKSLLSTNNIPLIEEIASQLKYNFQEIVISANDEEKYDFLKLPVIPDLEEGQGPLMGIYSTLLSSKHEINFVVACDIPYLNMEYVREMIRQAEDHQIVIPVWSDGRLDPLFGVYRKSIMDKVKKLLDTGNRKIRLLFKDTDVKYLPIPDEGTWYRNLNTMEDYRHYIRQ